MGRPRAFCFGALEFWSSGAVELWSFGASVLQCFCALAIWKPQAAKRGCFCTDEPRRLRQGRQSRHHTMPINGRYSVGSLNITEKKKGASLKARPIFTLLAIPLICAPCTILASVCVLHLLASSILSLYLRTQSFDRPLHCAEPAASMSLFLNRILQADPCVTDSLYRYVRYR